MCLHSPATNRCPLASTSSQTHSVPSRSSLRNSDQTSLSSLHSLRSLIRLFIILLRQLLMPRRLCSKPSSQPQPHKPQPLPIACPWTRRKETIRKERKGNKKNSLPKLIAVCAITVSLPAPCQCVSPAGICTISPTLNRTGSWPLEQIKPVPIVTVRICPRSALALCQLWPLLFDTRGRERENDHGYASRCARQA